MIDRHLAVRSGAVALTACLLLAGCSSSGGSGAPANSSPNLPGTTSAPTSSNSGTSTTSAAAVTIMIKNFAYTVSGAAAPGSQVKVTNTDGTAHTVTADSSGGFDVTIDPGKTETFTAPAQAGSYKFHCTFHANMHGTLKVG